jgi:hypothetical protein
MKTPFQTAPANTCQPDATKLAALLGLAAGAVALPQTGQADIIYTDLGPGGVSVGYASGSEYFFDLPGLPSSQQIGFQRSTVSTTFPITMYTARVLAGKFTAGDFAGVRGTPGGIVPLNFGDAWDQAGTTTFLNIGIGTANTFTRNPSSGFDNKYLAWQFTSGSSTYYGWAEISLSIGLISPGTGPNVTIWGYGYDNTGAKPTMGAVPEPSSGALFALGAMALGARGVRKWRENRQPAKQA